MSHNNTQTAARAVIKFDNKFLFVRHNNKRPENIGKWTYPGGRLQKGESLEDAIHREMAEEFGKAVRVEKFLLAVPYRDSMQNFVLCTTDSNFIDDAKVDRNEVLEYAWKSYDEIKALERNHLLQIGVEAKILEQIHSQNIAYATKTEKLLKIKAIIFDWGGTLVDAKAKEEFPESHEVLEYCQSKGYRLALACIASKPEDRKRQIANSHLRKFFEIALVDSLKPEQIYDPTFKGKDKLYDQINEHFKLARSQILIVDDRTARGIKYANEHGHPSIWIQKGKFASESPTAATGRPTYTIHNLSELLELL